MSKLYVFGIGGTGARVLKSLTMLLASGVDCDMDIVPMIIDPDISADSLTCAVDAFDAYVKVRGVLKYGSPNGHFFGTKIQDQVGRYSIPLQETNNKTFENYIKKTTMSDNNQAAMQMLFSSDNLASNMDVGFKGNPNMGSVVLNQFVGSNKFQQFANSFQQGDKIFIISSIFGGTGASGFPLLLKTLRSNNTLPNFNLLNNSIIGAITVLPYFSVQVNASSSIDSSSFIDKTKAALSYYDTNITGTNSVDYLYYIGDTLTPTYNNVEGGAGQADPPHVIELFSALSVIDFANDNQQRPQSTICKEFGIKNQTNTITFGDLGNVTFSQIAKPLTQFLLMKKYLDYSRIRQYRYQPWSIDAGFDKTFFSKGFERDVEDFLKIFYNWLNALNNNQRAFSPFDLNKNRHIFKMVKGWAPKLTALKSNYALFDDTLNYQKRPSGIGNEQWFIELFHKATNDLLKRKFNL